VGRQKCVVEVVWLLALLEKMLRFLVLVIGSLPGSTSFKSSDFDASDTLSLLIAPTTFAVASELPDNTPTGSSARVYDDPISSLTPLTFRRLPRDVPA